METTYLTHTYLGITKEAGGPGRGENPQRFANKSNWSAKINKQQRMRKQHDTKALQIPKGPPRRSRTVRGETADCISSSLTWPKLYLATFKLITNRWAWELVPRRLAGSKSHKPKGRYPWQPWKREPPKRNLSPGAWRMEGPENRVAWNLQSPMRPQAPSSQTSNARTNSTHLTRWTSTWGVRTGRQNSTLGPTHEACTKSRCKWQA